MYRRGFLAPSERASFYSLYCLERLSGKWPEQGLFGPHFMTRKRTTRVSLGSFFRFLELSFGDY